MASGTGRLRSSQTTDRGLVWDTGLHARHTAAMTVVKHGSEDDRELVLSYVVWPTELIATNLERAMRDGIAAARSCG